MTVKQADLKMPRLYTEESPYSNHTKTFRVERRQSCQGHETREPSGCPELAAEPRHGPITSVGSNQIDRFSFASPMDLLRLWPAASCC
jgi:hypothetical protein